ncbi:MAG: MurR/RpiR family transcriptional regulator [Paracoccaceae bacterium]|nr:MurR/RpiR family transcriptional regulator [Paracoccaceae bacterium]
MSAGQNTRLGVDRRVEAAVAGLSPAEARVALFFTTHKEAVVLNSAAQIAEAVGSSDATVVRTARSLGYIGLAELREDILTELTGAASPARLLSRTLDATSGEPAAVLTHLLNLHEDALAALRRPEFAEVFADALTLIGDAGMRHIFGIGPSGAIADYAALQFNRIGLRSQALTAPGVVLADQLAWIAAGDVVVMVAYAPLYREVAVILDHAVEVGAKVVLISDSLGPVAGARVAAVLSVPRGRSDHLALHSATFLLIEALTLGLAAQNRNCAIDRLDLLSRLRGRIDRDWLKRGTRRPVTPTSKDDLA